MSLIKASFSNAVGPCRTDSHLPGSHPHIHPALTHTQILIASATATAAMLPFATIIPKVFEKINTYVSFSEHVRKAVHSQYKKATQGIAVKRRTLVTMLSDRFRDVPGACS